MSKKKKKKRLPNGSKRSPSGSKLLNLAALCFTPSVLRRHTPACHTPACHTPAANFLYTLLKMTSIQIQRVPYFSYFSISPFCLILGKEQLLSLLQHPVTILVTDFTNPDNLSNNLENSFQSPPLWDHPGYTKDWDPLAVLYLDNQQYIFA